MGRFRTAYNPTAGPVLIDDEGHSLGGHEWGPVEAGHSVVDEAVERGALTLLATDTEAEAAKADPDAEEAGLPFNREVIVAAHRTAELNSPAKAKAKARPTGDDESAAASTPTEEV